MGDRRGDVGAGEAVETAGADACGLLDAAADLRSQLITASELSSDAIDGAIIGVPGAVDPSSGAIRLGENVAGLEDLQLGERLESRLGVRVSVENDINLAAVGEQWRGVGRGVANFAFLPVGAALACGLL